MKFVSIITFRLTNIEKPFVMAIVQQIIANSNDQFSVSAKVIDCNRMSPSQRMDFYDSLQCITTEIAGSE